jgi:threonylcarbamoyladenosine tRNA methylthiotransferase MtaB
MFRFSVVTFGCRVNQADSFACERDLREAGGVAVEPHEAHLVLVNTCSVTAAADQAARHAIRRIARRNPAARIVATGCYATRTPADLETLPGVIRLIPNDQKERLGSWLSALGSRLPSVQEPEAQSPPPFAFHPGDRGRTAFPLRVQTGCDEACSYCTIPASRGPSRSRAVDDVIGEAKRLADAGYAELILTGVHLGAYGRDLRPASSLLELLQSLARVPGSFRVRISSLEPMDCPREAIALVAASPRFAPHFHFPIQHASDRLLAAMRRPYRLADYRSLVAFTRAAMPDAAIGCDVIVGFPGETESDHEELQAYLSSSPVTHLHVFPYSERPGTAAASMEGKVSARVASNRCAALRRVAEQLRRTFAAGQVGQVREAITIEDGRRAVTDNYLKVAIAPGRRRNERIRVRILSPEPSQGEVLA